MDVKVFCCRGFENCYGLTIGDETAVIDLGSLTPEVAEFASGANITKILLTHRHYDHILGVAELKELTGAEVYISALDECGLYNPEDCLRRGRLIPTRADVLLNDGDEINIGDEIIRVIATPGHTVGSVCFAAGDYLFTGDTLFNANIGRCDLPTGNLQQMEESLKKLAGLDKDYIVYPGHGESSRLFYEIKNNPYLNALERQDF